jgi:hypothetical protein
MLPVPSVLVYDNHRMTKQAISVTLSPDNLVWLRGRTRAEGLASLSECLDRLITGARSGGHAPREVRSMKGALVGLAAEPVDTAAAISPAVWQAWHARWDELLDGLDPAAPATPRAPRRSRRG